MKRAERNRVATDLGLIKLHSEAIVDSMWGRFVEAEDGYIYVAAGNHKTYEADSWIFRVDPRRRTSEIAVSVSDTLGRRAAPTAVGEAKVEVAEAVQHQLGHAPRAQLVEMRIVLHPLRVVRVLTRLQVKVEEAGPLVAELAQ